jgi:three-Cys-motif partner protein
VNKTAKVGLPKKDEEFFETSLDFFVENGKNLQRICPDTVDGYNDHSLLKLISIAYWVGFFSPIAHRQLKEKYGYRIAYVDTMAGSGVTSTKRSGDFFCGSCPGALLSASVRKFPFDLVFAVEIDPQKGDALKKRLETLLPQQNVTVFNKDIADVSQVIAQELRYQTISYIVIDPQAFQGMTWAGIGPLLQCKGDAMVTWFEAECWRIKCAAIAQNEHQAAEASGNRLTELFGSEQWKNAQSPEGLTALFIERVLCDCGKTAHAKIKIPRSDGGYYWMILFTKAAKVADEWKKHVEKRINSAHGQDIAVLLDVKAGRTSTLKNWIKTE